MKVAVSFNVPEPIVPAIDSMSRLTNLTNDQIGQRLVDELLPRLISGEIDGESVMTVPTLLRTFPELDAKLKEYGLDTSNPNEMADFISIAMTFLSVADAVVAPCMECE